MSFRIKCVTCGKAKYITGQPVPPTYEGFKLQCDQCYEGSPGAPRKTIRHCSICRDPLVVMGVPGGVRLLCKNCALTDLTMVEVEGLGKERDKFRSMANDAMEEATKAQEALSQMEGRIDELVAAKTAGTIEENENLAAQLAKKEETSLADRLRMKMKMQYGETDKQKFQEFAEWFIGRLREQAPSGDAPEVAETVVREYLGTQ